MTKPQWKWTFSPTVTNPINSKEKYQLHYFYQIDLTFDGVFPMSCLSWMMFELFKVININVSNISCEKGAISCTKPRNRALSHMWLQGVFLFTKQIRLIFWVISTMALPLPEMSLPGISGDNLTIFWSFGIEPTFYYYEIDRRTAFSNSKHDLFLFWHPFLF